MIVYIGHSTDYDYLNELYKPIRESEGLKKYNIILPHENKTINTSRDFYRNIDVFIAEVSYPSLGLGIEIGYALDDKTEINCIYKRGTKPSSIVKYVSDDIFSYESDADLIEIIESIVNKRS